MYWPISAPRVYAAASSTTSKKHIYRFDDSTEESDSLPTASSTLSDVDAPDDEPSPGLQTPATPKTPGINPIEHDAQRRLSARNLGALEKAVANGHVDGAIGQAEKDPILGLRASRSGHLFAVITATSMTIWQTKPTVILAKVVRSKLSLKNYGPNVALLVRPDSAIFVVQTTLGYLITYSLASDPDARVYKPHFAENSSVNTRRQSNFIGSRSQGDRILWGPGEGGGVREISIRFRMVIKVDAGIGYALALDEELVVATEKPAALQCIRWTPDSTGNQTSTELLRKMGWFPKDSRVVNMTYDRPMNLSTWITSEGEVYAVQRLVESKEDQQVKASDDPDDSSVSKKSTSTKKLFGGYCFHSPDALDDKAVKAAINARFSLIAVGCADGSIHIYSAKDYVGNIPLSHKQKLSVSLNTSGQLTFLSYSPDGYCLFAGYEHGWATWSVFGKAGSASFLANQEISEINKEGWLSGVSQGIWLGSGSEIMLIGRNDDRLWIIEMARSSVTGCFTSANISRTVLQAGSSIMVYQGYDVPDLTSISAEASLWHNAEIPSSYLVDHWPIRCSVISSDGRYVAVAGRRGLAHYSVNSGRWKTFVSENMENEFQVRGGMCWHQHILVAAVEAGNSFEVRLYSRESTLDSSLVLHTEYLPAPIVLVAPSGDDSLLVYTHDNLLYHYIFTSETGSIRLVQVGQIAFNGIVRSPARVRGLSWILPDEQVQEGDPSQDVAVATVLFLVDGKLVLLQPSLNEEHKLKYDMRVIAQNIEYYSLVRDQSTVGSFQDNAVTTPRLEDALDGRGGRGLRDSLWMFDGSEIKVWTDVQDLLRSAPADLGRELPPTVSIPVDFYPLSIVLGKGILLGVESEIIQRRDISFAFFRFALRTHLFIPQILRHHLAHFDSSSALHLAHQYQNLHYFAHALEILLHNVLDEEVDTTPPPEAALLPGVISFLSLFPQYLDIVVQCTRKTEVRSWRTLFAYLPPPTELFEVSLQKGLLKTAGGYLLVLHTFEELSSSSEQLVRLLGRAKDEGDWELCKELARFLMALDESGATLKEALELVDLRSPHEKAGTGSFMFENMRLKVPRARNGVAEGSDTSSIGSSRRYSSGSGSGSNNHSPTEFGPDRLMVERGGTAGDYFMSKGT
ncbi:MAG: hypothetical protein M1818_007788 [Claussenomyces sp. TS43310]|nr:MAG: hypothetical protein M1818_007788 [Claussenomyces sp. TS43310]